jgi:hypothetical protein
MQDGHKNISTHDALVALGLHPADDLKEFFVRKRNYLESVARAKYKPGGDDIEIKGSDLLAKR